MSAQPDAVSAILGEYMLKSWTLTDLHCDTCRITPLMREPQSIASKENRQPIQFCALCDGSPSDPTSSSSSASLSTSTVRQPNTTSSTSRTSMTGNSALVQTSFEEDEEIRRAIAEIDASLLSSSNPNTNLIPSSATGLSISSTSNTFNNQTSIGGSGSGYRRPVDVSELISQKLLSGYSLLQTNCPNSECRGIPLVGLPRSAEGVKSKERECLNCGSRYLEETPNRLIILKHGSVGGVSSGRTDADRSENKVNGDRGIGGGGGGESPRSRKLKELYGLSDDSINDGPTNPTISKKHQTESSSPTTINRRATQSHPQSQSQDHSAAPLGSSSRSSDISPLQRTATSLTATLEILSTSLSHTAQTISNSGAGGGAIVEHNGVFIDMKLHTEAMKDVLDILEKVKKVQA